MKKIWTFDTTLRDGMQAEKIAFTVEDKLKIVSLLDELGIDYIEAGNPGSNRTDEEFFRQVNQLPLKHSKLAAFGSTRKVGIEAGKDENLKKIIEAKVPVAVIFGKAWDMHVTEVLGTSLEENLNMIHDSVLFLKEHGKEVFFDAEHFFDGYQRNPSYAIEVLRTAQQAGADAVVLCDTNGGMFPEECFEITKAAVEAVSIPVGIHTHNDGGMAVANCIMAVSAGATQVQGTLNGIGERCGNANLSTIIANLGLKREYTLIPRENLESLTRISRAVAEVANISISGMPYVSKGAFSHKAGMHINAVLKNPASFEHINPEAVGNRRNILVSEMAGRSAVLPAIRAVDPSIEKDSPKIAMILDRLKELEYDGYQFEGAGASLELVIRKCLGLYQPFFRVEKFKVLIEQEQEGNTMGYASAIIKVLVDGREEITASDSNGPVHAIDTALRKALDVFYPELKEVQLVDYKVRVLNSEAATAAKVRVLIETFDGKEYWTTVGVSTDVIEASRQALIDSIEYKLIRSKKGGI